MKPYDFVVIGAGSAGLTGAGLAAKAGLRTAVLDCGPVGGLCALNGCNPKKVLIRSTEMLDEIIHAGEFGIELKPPKINWSKVIDRKESFTKPVTKNTKAWLKAQKIDLIQGFPRFLAPLKIQIGKREIDVSGGLLIASGSRPRTLTFNGFSLLKTTDDVLALRKIPKKISILGAGVVAFEFGQMFARLGSEVTLLTNGRKALPEFDEDMTSHLLKFSRNLGMRVVFEAKVLQAEKEQGRINLHYEHKGRLRKLPSDFALNAAGRVPSLQGLDLEKANVASSEKGVAVNEYLQSTSNPHAYAAGDAHGRMMLSPVASYEGRVAAQNFLEGNTEKVNYDCVPHILFTVPPLAAVGLTEKDAKDKGLEVLVRQHDMSSWKVYQIEGHRIGFSKIILERESGKILGAHLYGPSAGEEIHLFAMAITFGLPGAEFKKMIWGYPVLASTLPYALD